MLPGFIYPAAQGVYQIGMWNAAEPDYRIFRIGALKRQVHQAENLKEERPQNDIVFYTPQFNLVCPADKDTPLYPDDLRRDLVKSSPYK